MLMLRPSELSDGRAATEEPAAIEDVAEWMK